jgi:hypothetical protein
MVLHLTRDTSSELSIACSQQVVRTHDELSVLCVLRGSSFLDLFTRSHGRGSVGADCFFLAVYWKIILKRSSGNELSFAPGQQPSLRQAYNV